MKIIYFLAGALKLINIRLPMGKDTFNAGNVERSLSAAQTIMDDSHHCRNEMKQFLRQLRSLYLLFSSSMHDGVSTTQAEVTRSLTTMIEASGITRITCVIFATRV